MSNRVLQIEEIRDAGDFERLKEEWGQLQERCNAPSLFLSHPWLMVCARNLLPGQRLLVLLLRRQGALVGAVPLVEERARLRWFPVRQLGFLANPLTPFSDFLLESPKESLRAILEHLFQITNWDILFLDRLRQDSPTRTSLEDLLRESQRTFALSLSSQTPFLDIHGPWEEFWRSRSQKFRKTRRSITNRMERLGRTSVEVIRDPQHAKEGLEELLELSRRSWTRKEGMDLLTPDFERAFLRELAKVAAEYRWLRIWLLKSQDRFVAGEFHLHDRGIEYGLRAHYDGTIASSSPGTYLDTRVVQTLFENGTALYDMGPGMLDYKTAWTDNLYECHAVRIFHKKLYARVLGCMESSWIPAVKKSFVGQWLSQRSEGDRAQGDSSEEPASEG